MPTPRADRSDPGPRALYVMGGQQRSPRPLNLGNRDWHGYHKGLIVRVDPCTGDSHVCVSYTSPPEVCADEEPEILFQAGTVLDGTLYACTGTEILIYRLPDFAPSGYISLPWFNDVHHVRPTPQGTLLIANAGLEMVMEVTTAGEVLRVWNVLGEAPWERFSRDVDWRQVASTKPHRSHPNYLFMIGDEIWATRFQQGDAICLTDPGKSITISHERIHDGVVYDGYVYFTTVSGSIVVANTTTLQVEDVIDLNSMHEDGSLLGWCRGIMLDGDRVWVGFSHIRPTKVRENVAFIMRGFKQVKGTHIACYDLARRRHVVDIDLEPAGLNAVFSIFSLQ